MASTPPTGRAWQTANAVRKDASANVLSSGGSPGTDQLAQRRKELEAQVTELERRNTELEKKLDDDGRQFLEALLSLESEIEELNKQNKKLLEDRTQTEDKLRRQGSEGELRARNLRMERECEDVLQQMEQFEREKDEELRVAREEATRSNRRAQEVEEDFKRRLGEMERERDALLDHMTQEGRELQARMEKITRDKEVLSVDLAKALARADVANSGSDAVGADGQRLALGQNAEAMSQLKSVMSENEALKDEVTNKEGQAVLLRSQLEIAERKLRLADMENNMLKSEFEALRQQQSHGDRKQALPTLAASR